MDVFLDLYTLPSILILDSCCYLVTSLCHMYTVLVLCKKDYFQGGLHALQNRTCT